MIMFLDSTTLFLWIYHSIVVPCLVLVSVLCSTDVITSGEINGVSELYFFNSQEAVMAKEIFPALRGSKKVVLAHG